MLFYLARCATWPIRLLVGIFNACFDTVLDGLSAAGLTSRDTVNNISRREERRWLMNISESERRDKRHIQKRTRNKKRKLRDPEHRIKECAKTQRFSRGKVISHLAEMNRSVSVADNVTKAIA